MRSWKLRRSWQTGVLLGGLLPAWPAEAYFGPGAGIGLVGYFFGMLGALAVTVVMVIGYPIYWIRRKLRAKRVRTEAQPGESANREGQAS